MSTTFVMQPTAGTHIRDVIAEAVALAIQRGVPVCFEFNETAFQVEPSDSYESAKTRWAELTGIEVLTADEDQKRASDWLETKTREDAAAIAAARVPSEAEMRDAKVPWPKSIEEMNAYIKTLVDRPHDYGTCVYAMSMAAAAAFYYVSHVLGVTGFQAGCADIDFLRRTRSLEFFSIRDYSKLLYPQYGDHFENTLTPETWKALQEKAAKLIAEDRAVHPDVLAHWQAIVGGVLPFGFEVNAR